ncbi:MAG: hypothetical protein F6J90_02775 [Moorea sp. SIOASIH]|uniref:hypothetical protein n=1 Tax=Moorena sp. SIOASIH TaxID=2607817 RepID=UPI0013BD9BFD|nr:hypothetical protein [Moorena sp. SIOASIH]NEO35284.1 hypothetical protein [Moorena sp. SIOASIH]
MSNKTRDLFSFFPFASCLLPLVFGSMFTTDDTNALIYLMIGIVIISHSAKLAALLNL